MTEKERQTEKLGKETIAKMLNMGFSEEEIGIVLMSSLSEVLWEQMTEEQKVEYENDYEKFRHHNTEQMKKDLQNGKI